MVIEVTFSKDLLYDIPITFKLQMFLLKSFRKKLVPSHIMFQVQQVSLHGRKTRDFMQKPN